MSHAHTASLEDRDLLRPDLPEDSAVKLIGLGGVGGIVARFGALFLASLGRNVRLVMIDGDAFEPSNTSRMHFSAFGNKATVLRQDLLPRFQDSRLSIFAVGEYLTEANIGRLIQEGDIVLLAVDNHATRKLVGEFCATKRDICLISGGNDGVETTAEGNTLRGTYGNCQIHLRRDGADLTPSLGRYHPEIAHPADHAPTELDCVEMAASVPQILFANLMAASCMLNALWLHLCGALGYSEICFDVADGLMRPVELPVGLPSRRD